ncbi:MAG: hypothetical protein HXX12_06765 [Geothrix sp.]|uniref:hypothetical protein n=1 Tax=Geothrix sp. TaxID=1962974 RepID=UPI00185303C3|nr:hypothetical protein [Geothrix sp.]NWJ40656.1 hypothetical protein [Geothrix sp.]WIL21335.1 MAG: hypothetical protein QOZ81_000592 [Geothrix sp.]
MYTITYNDMTFTVEPRGDRWDISYALPNGSSAIAGAGLFAGLPGNEAAARALALIKTIFPVGIKSVGPDVSHPNTIGDLKIVGPDVTHPNFIYWNKDSVSCPVQL